MKRIKSLILILIISIVGFAFFLLDFRFDCLFKKYLKVRCPGCGLTRSLVSFLNLDFVASFKYNILGIPIVLATMTVLICSIIDLIKGNNFLVDKLIEIVYKYKLIIFLILIITMVINNINQI